MNYLLESTERKSKKKENSAELVKATEKKNKGQLIVDATCTPADIRFPTDMSILNEARMNTEKFIDFLYTSFRELFDKKPRDYREIAHTDFIAYTKKRKPRPNIRRKAKRKQINYLKHNIKHIDNTLSNIEDIEAIDNWKLISLRDRHRVIKKVYDQQFEMFVKKTRSVSDRIVSISQPHVRPIVRGKAGKAVEFRAKISLSVVQGFSYIDHFYHGIVLMNQRILFHR